MLGVTNAVNSFMPLVKRSTTQRVTRNSPEMVEANLINGYEIFEAGPYALSKAAVNVVVAKDNATHKGDMILLLAISPDSWIQEAKVPRLIRRCRGGSRKRILIPGFDFADEVGPAVVKVVERA